MKKFSPIYESHNGVPFVASWHLQERIEKRTKTKDLSSIKAVSRRVLAELAAHERGERSDCRALKKCSHDRVIFQVLGYTVSVTERNVDDRGGRTIVMAYPKHNQFVDKLRYAPLFFKLRASGRYDDDDAVHRAVCAKLGLDPEA